ncbi:hypothetical protein [Streptomyces sp. NBC_01244]|uniref:hypothetical protein n=1 Tax=Streptomyces sp. NBC_01244 TaxID=2903797 RepID=UPI002E148404|nr:hypothetical protein OG247_44570 [Streptomyces sp. NBC_01244]
MRMDRDFEACTFVVVGLELVREFGTVRVASVAALAIQGTGWTPQWRVHARVAGAAEVAKPASEREDVSAGSVGAALAEIERRLTETPHLVVARLGAVEAATFWEHRAFCPRLASLMVWDAMRLAQITCPSVAEVSEQTLAAALGVDLPGAGSALTQRVWATSEICHRAVARGVAAGRWSTLRQVEDRVGRRPRPVEEHFLPTGPVQESLFD